MKSLLLVLLMVAAPSTTTEPEDPYRWMLSSPSGLIYDGVGEILPFRMTEEGLWLVHLTTLYRHQEPGGSYYEHTTSTIYHSAENPDLIFADGVDSRTPLVRWSTTKGAPNE